MSARVKKALLRFASPERQAFLPKFFKTGKGEYAEGDRFIGVTVPECRSIAKVHADLSFDALAALLDDPYHEVRLVALLVLTAQFEQADAKGKKKIVDFYLSHLHGVNNWDLVDLSAYNILGNWLIDRERSILHKLAKSKNLWEQRIAIVSTYAFIRQDDFGDVLSLSEQLLSHRHDLIHKAVGWMLREVGKRDADLLRAFLHKHAAKMPRTALRYAIERFPEAERKGWLVR